MWYTKQCMFVGVHELTLHGNFNSPKVLWNASVNKNAQNNYNIILVDRQCYKVAQSECRDYREAACLLALK